MRIVHAKNDRTEIKTDVTGDHFVIVPANAKEVADALKIAREHGVDDPIFRSGTHRAHDTEVDGEGSVVISLRKLKAIELSFPENKVRVGAGVSTVALAERLAANGLFLPLDCTPGKSVISNARAKKEKGPLVLAKTAGILRDYVKSVEGIMVATGEAFALSTVGVSDALKSNDYVITALTLKTSWKDLQGVYVASVHLPYITNLYKVIIDYVFVSADVQAVKSKLDLCVRITEGKYGGYSSIVVTGACKKTYKVTLDTLLDEVVRSIEEKHTIDAGLIQRTNASTPRDVMLSLVSLAECGNDDILASYRRRRFKFTKSQVEAKAFLENLCKSIDAAVGCDEESVMKHADISLSSTLTLRDDGGVDVAVIVHHPVITGDRTSTTMVSFFELGPQHPDELAAEEVGGPPIKKTARARAVKPLIEQGLRKDQDIPNFKGETFKKGDDDYESEAYCYATTSYEHEKERFEPYVIAIPKDTDDVKAAVEYAIRQGMKVVARSGGHQYCGLSTGGNDTILLKMDSFNEMDVVDNIATLGPCCKLTDVAAELHKHNITIPHGECLYVNIGGHVQSGGLGHIMRSYGLCLDHVKSFDIVVAKSTGKAELKTINRPNAAVTKPSEVDDYKIDWADSCLDDKIYWGVLGGGPGSFGVVTKVVFECIRDAEHPHSRGFQKTFLGYSKEQWARCMKVCQEHTQKVVTEELDQDFDLMMTLMSGSIWNPTHPSWILVEMVHGNTGGLAQNVPSDVFDSDITKINGNGLSIGFTRISPKEHRSLSYMSNSFVRNFGMTRDGREFRFPYHKRMNCTKVGLSDSFIESFVELVDEVMTTRGLCFVYQMVMGGGNYAKNGTDRITAFPWRDIVIGIIFDIFYQDGYSDEAEKLQKKMQKLLPEMTGNPDKPEDDPACDIRQTWASFGKNISMDDMWEHYYGQDGTYQLLQQLKEAVDPHDVFTTIFTVQMPQKK